MNEENLEEALAIKKRSLDEIGKQMRQRFSATEYTAALNEVLQLERLVAERHGAPHAVEWSVPDIWQGMTLDFLVIGGQLSCCVLFETRPKSNQFNVLEFKMVAGYKLTDVNDEIIEAHPLAGRGLTAYGAFIVRNSPWLLEVKTINKSHPQYDSKNWQNIQHYMLCFKDRLFETLAKNFALVGTFETIDNAIGAALERIS